MQKINSIHYVLLALSLSSAAMHAVTPESIAAAMNFCQERFNTADKDLCQRLIEKKINQNTKEGFALLSHSPFTEPTEAQKERNNELYEENKILNKHLSTLRNDELTPDQLFEIYIRLLTESLERCNAEAEAKNLVNCFANEIVDNVKIIINMPDALRAAQTPEALQFIHDFAIEGEKSLEDQIRDLKRSPDVADLMPIPVHALEQLLEQVKAARTKLATVITP